MSNRDDDDHDFSMSLDPDRTWEKIKSYQLFQDVPTISSEESVWDSGSTTNDCTRIVCMSDTHGLHRDVAIPKGDVLIHAGDFTQTGELSQIQDLISFFQQQQSTFQSIVCIAGNHDMTLDVPYYQRSWRRFHKKRKQLDTPDQAKQSMIQYMNDSASGGGGSTTGNNGTDSCGSSDDDHGQKPNNSNASKFYYLEDSSCSIPIRGDDDASLSVYGAPWSPEFYDWAFNVPRGEPSNKIWSKIPTQTDVLITHGPPLGRGDLCCHGGRAGCYDLLQHVQQRVKPRLMIFGHIHEGYGVEYDGTTIYVNASNLDVEYDNVHPCIVIDLPNDPTQPPRVVEPYFRKGPLAARPRAAAGGGGGGGQQEQQVVDLLDLCSWLRENGYDILANVMEKPNCIADNWLTMTMTGEQILQTPQAYKTISQHLRISTYQELKARKELRKALSQLRAESY